MSELRILPAETVNCAWHGVQPYHKPRFEGDGTCSKCVSALPLSQSLQLDLACPILYATKHEQGIKEPQNEFAIRGTRFHEIMARYVKHLVETRQESDFAHLQGIILECDNQEAVELARKQGHSFNINPEMVLGVEIFIGLDKDFNHIEEKERRSEIIYHGTLDLVEFADDMTAVIKDFKTYWNIVDADTFQASMYAMLLFATYPHIQKIRFDLKFVRYGEASRSVHFLREKDFENLKDMIARERRKQITIHEVYQRGDKLEAMPGKHCQWCPKLNCCPIKETNPFTELTPLERVKYGIWLNAAKKQNDAVLKAFADKEPIAYEDGNGVKYEAGFHGIESGHFPIYAGLEVLESWEEDKPERDKVTPKAYIGGISSYLKAKKRADLAEKMEAVKVKEYQTRFLIRGIDEEQE
jgi:hypothetical protein